MGKKIDWSKLKPAKGYKVKDDITGIEGIAVNHTSCLTGCDYLGVQPDAKDDGNIPEAKGIDIMRLTVTGPGVREKYFPEEYASEIAALSEPENKIVELAKPGGIPEVIKRHR